MNIYGPSAATGLGVASGSMFWMNMPGWGYVLIGLAAFTLLGALGAFKRITPTWRTVTTTGIKVGAASKRLFTKTFVPRRRIHRRR